MSTAQVFLDLEVDGITGDILDGLDLDDGILELGVILKLHLHLEVAPVLFHETVVTWPANRCRTNSVGAEVGEAAFEVRVSGVTVRTVERKLNATHNEIMIWMMRRGKSVQANLEPSDEIAKRNIPLYDGAKAHLHENPLGVVKRHTGVDGLHVFALFIVFEVFCNMKHELIYSLLV